MVTVTWIVVVACGDEMDVSAAAVMLENTAGLMLFIHINDLGKVRNGPGSFFAE